LRIRRLGAASFAETMLLAVFVLVFAVVGPGSVSSGASTLRIQSGLGGPKLSVQVDSPSELQFRGVVLAERDTSCAAACIATVLTHYFDEPTTEQEALTGLFAERLRAGTGFSSAFSLLDIKNVLDRWGYQSSGLRGTVESLRQQSPFPAILLIDIGDHPHFTVLRAMSDEEVFLADPIFGNIAAEISEFEQRWNGVLLAFDQLIADEQSNHQLDDILLDLKPPGIPSYTSVKRMLEAGFSLDLRGPNEF